MKHARRVVSHVFFGNFVELMLDDFCWVVATSVESSVRVQMLCQTVRVGESRTSHRVRIDVVDEFKAVRTIAKLVFRTLRLNLWKRQRLIYLHFQCSFEAFYKVRQHNKLKSLKWTWIMNYTNGKLTQQTTILLVNISGKVRSESGKLCFFLITWWLSVYDLALTLMLCGQLQRRISSKSVTSMWHRAHHTFARLTSFALSATKNPRHPGLRVIADPGLISSCWPPPGFDTWNIPSSTHHLRHFWHSFTVPDSRG